jgi:uncharacterized protein YhaN
VATRVASLHDRLALHRSQSDRLAEVQALWDETGARVSSLLARLGDGFDETQLRALRLTATCREELRAWRQRLDAERILAREREATIRIAAEQRDRARVHLSRLVQQGPDAPSRREVVRALALVAALVATAAVAGWLTGGAEGLVLAAAFTAAGTIWLSARRRRDRGEAARKHAREHVDLQVAQAAAAEDEHRVGMARLASHQESFRAWKESVGVPSALSPDGATEFLEDVRRGRDALEEADGLAAERRRLDLEVNDWNAGVDAVVADCTLGGAPTDSHGDAGRIALLTALRERCESDRAVREGREPLERHAALLRERFVARETALEVVRESLTALLEEAGVEDTEELERRLAGRDAARELAEKIARAEEALARRITSGGPDEAAYLRERLPSGRVADWEERASATQERIARIRAQRDEVLREHQDAARSCERLEGSTAVMDLELRKSALEQELREVLDEWRRLQLARGLIDAALERFEARHQPGVLRGASRLFNEVTGGRYPRIVQSDQERAGFSVLNEEGMHRSPKELSRGTAEQLYLCVRLGLVAELARTRVPLPVAMDDVLVNFDDERAAAMAEVLATFATDHQLIFFTCSSRTRDLLVGARNDVDERTFPEPARLL